jgi:hypothetical protein
MSAKFRPNGLHRSCGATSEDAHGDQLLMLTLMAPRMENTTIMLSEIKYIVRRPKFLEKENLWPC